ncbi:DUF2509 family protein [Proteus alimentorum]|uniref:DUF2509 family protein n=1 Tax=Proteus alimentorum TaxID=1973495 RepID=UPI000BFFE53C|nr:DUF2509 family protein [Proteus alimentorum]
MSIDTIHNKNEQGFASLLVVIGFIVVSLSALGSFAYHYRQSQQIVVQELQARQAFLFAESALAWGIKLDWEILSSQLNKWQCRHFHANPKIKSCLFLISLEKGLLQGQAKSTNGYKIYHYQWVDFLKDKNKFMVAHPNGWLDYCPLVYKECVL